MFLTPNAGICIIADITRLQTVLVRKHEIHEIRTYDI